MGLCRGHTVTGALGEAGMHLHSCSLRSGLDVKGCGFILSRSGPSEDAGGQWCFSMLRNDWLFQNDGH